MKNHKKYARVAAIHEVNKEVLVITKEFKVGDNVVYPSHGVGKIVEIEEQHIGGMSLELLVVAFDKDKMSLKIPVNKAKKNGLRHLIGQKELNEVVTILQSKSRRSKGMWSKRASEYESKIHSGQLTLVAEVVRDLFKDADASTERSYSEKVLYELALTRLSSEYALLKDMNHENATDNILMLLKDRALAS